MVVEGDRGRAAQPRPRSWKEPSSGRGPGPMADQTGKNFRADGGEIRCLYARFLAIGIVYGTDLLPPTTLRVEEFRLLFPDGILSNERTCH
jgi:hypothetical protein